MLTVVLYGGADHPWRLDLSAAAVIAAAIGTLVLAGFTAILAKRTSQLAQETKQDVATSRRGIESSIRPMLVGVPLRLPENAIAETIRYLDGTEETLRERGAIDIRLSGEDLRLSAPFRNVGNGVALVRGNWARTEDNKGRVSSGVSLGIVGPEA